MSKKEQNTGNKKGIYLRFDPIPSPSSHTPPPGLGLGASGFEPHTSTVAPSALFETSIQRFYEL
jgi:hypothetical protein